ncbi:hypothetical protein BH09PSE5_BH09PSE5_26570 [soil metagenome]
MQVTRYATLPEGIVALTATARGMIDNSMMLAAQNAFGELMETVSKAGLMPRMRSSMSLSPDEPQRPNDPQCRYVAGAIFGYSMAQGTGQCEQPEVALTGTLAWQPLSPGRYAVFTHIGPYTTLGKTWAAIYDDWVPNSGIELRPVPPLELSLNSPRDTEPEALHTEIWLPVP